VVDMKNVIYTIGLHTKLCWTFKFSVHETGCMVDLVTLEWCILSPKAL